MVRSAKLEINTIIRSYLWATDQKINLSLCIYQLVQLAEKNNINDASIDLFNSFSSTHGQMIYLVIGTSRGVINGCDYVPENEARKIPDMYMAVFV